MMETIKVKLDDRQMAKIIYKVTEKMMFDANRIKVVRCKDCKQFRKKGEGYGCCLEGYGNVDGNHYCSFGERKENVD